MREAIVKTGKGKFGQTVTVGPHQFIADEAKDVGGDDTGPSPHELLQAALATCTSMTVRVYADRKGWPVESVTVHVSGEKREDGYHIDRSVHFEGALDDEQRARLLEIANKCPVHKTLSGTIHIATTVV
jgi:putative redox protein